MKWLKSRQEEKIVVVTHSAFLRNLLTEPSNRALIDAYGVIEQNKFRRFQNCELRTFDVYFR
jgi:hypothetical protein